jgi:large subunit ribosomal protein L6
MSRIGRKPIYIPEGVKVSISGDEVTVEGPKGKLSRKIHPFVSVSVVDGAIKVERRGETRFHKAIHGLTRALIYNMVEGVTNGFRKGRELNGVGYSAVVKGRQLVLELGYSHPVIYDIPDGITIQAERIHERQYKIYVSGIDKYLVGQVAAIIRSFRPPDPYQRRSVPGLPKGIRYEDEQIKLKQGKTGAGGKR